MKSVLIFFLSLLISAEAFCQQTSAITREVKKTAKEFRNEGWKTISGSESLESQIANLFQIRERVTPDVSDKIIGSRSAVGLDYASARKHALAMAKADLAGQLESRISSLYESAMDTEEGRQSSSSSSKVFVEECVRKTQTVMELYRTLTDGKVEVYVSLSCDISQIGALK